MQTMGSQKMREALPKLLEAFNALESTPSNILACVDQLVADLEPANLDIRATAALEALQGSTTRQAFDNASGADLALAGLKQLGQTVLDSGIPQAALTFAVTYKLLDGLSNAAGQAQNEFGIGTY